MHLKHFLSTLALASFALPAVQAQSLDNVFRAFSKCDASFFKAMKDEAQTVQALAPTDSKGDAMWFKVPNRTDDKTGTVALTGRPTIAGMPVVSYEDSVIDIGSLGLYYTWGFKVRGELANAFNLLKPLIFENERLRKDDSVYVRTELQTGASAWLPVKTAGGTVPKSGTVERALLIEPDDKDKSLAMVTCTIQGSVDATHLKELRPDIDVKNYPVKQEVVTYDSVNVAADLISKLQESLKAQPLFVPKFNKAVIEYKTVFADGGGYEKIDTLLRAQNGILENISEVKNFGDRRQTVTNLVQLKYASFFDGNKQVAKYGVLVANDAELEVAQKLTKGAIGFKSTVKTIQLPRKNDNPDTVSVRICFVGDRFLASTVFGNLTGQATLLRCVFDDKNDDATTFALVEDLGLMLWYEPNETKRKFKPVYTSITIER
jgi:hypothetical protein